MVKLLHYFNVTLNYFMCTKVQAIDILNKLFQFKKERQTGVWLIICFYFIYPSFMIIMNKLSLHIGIWLGMASIDQLFCLGWYIFSVFMPF